MIEINWTEWKLQCYYIMTDNVYSLNDFFRTKIRRRKINIFNRKDKSLEQGFFLTSKVETMRMIKISTKLAAM